MEAGEKWSGTYLKKHYPIHDAGGDQKVFMNIGDIADDAVS
jgi:hypothetical protein